MNWNALLPEIVLSIGVLIIFVLELVLKERYYKSLTILGFVAIVASAFSVLFVHYPASTLFDGFTVSGFNLIAKFFLLAVTGLVLISSYDFFMKKNSVYSELSYLYLIALLGLMVMLSSENLAIIFVGLELASITMYILVGLFKREYFSKEGAFKYLVIGTTGTSMFALGSGLVYGSTGSLLLGIQRGEDPIFALGVLLIMSALALKVSAVPFHFWTPDAYEGAPTPTTSFLATVPKIAMYFLFVKLTVYMFSALPKWEFLIGVVAIASMFYGNLMAYAQRSVKRLLAYSSIAHAGYFTLALTVVDKLLMTSLLFYVFVYALATLGAFTVLSVLEKKRGWTHHFLDFKGIAKEHPFLSSALAFFLFALIGLPPMAIFVGKLGIFMGLVKNELFLYAILFVIGSLISAGYYLKVIVYMFLHEKERDWGATGISAGESFALLVSTVAVLIFGLFPHAVLDFLLRLV
ncbi:NADH-quinone oxidoreductase subunit N [Hydrogenivirga sp. 128-5-R1-1]|uniref:NADH-quinone oxidoreductase subunit N n=1 Tax=Hydrogenivirga sp. 128-5-R1-1 TaxID=392423 RepID=UPI00015F3708|nr:NADH-quinone oxidoreductase subunit N [Hydrogenivirga sp. 128-5-R1-1]EDP76490.1 NADH dehydrogenase I chain N [Hydrogenivirga sp. 128-5-R1-1]